MEKIYKHLGYYSNLEDIQKLYDKTDEYVVEEMLKGNGYFNVADYEEHTEHYLKCCDAGFVDINNTRYAVVRDYDWDISDLDDLDANSDEDNDLYDRSPSYIDVYLVKE